MIETSEIEALWQELALGPVQASQLRQVAIIATALIVAYVLHRFFRPAKTNHASLKFGLSGIQRVLFPISALLMVEIGKHFLHTHQSVRLLNISASLLIALTFIRVIVYLLRSIFSESKLLHVSEKSLVGMIWLGFALHITGQLQWLISALDELSFPVGKHEISVLMLINGALSISITLILSMWIGRSLERKILSSDVLDSSLRVMLAKLSRALLIIVGIMIALPLVGIDLTLFSVFGGALGVGLGLGLQKIASNYVSGFIILLDRSIRLGNFLTVDNKYGEVTKLTARYLVLRQSDGTEAIIPNDTLITSVVLNHSYSDQNMLIQIALLLTHDSDTHLAKDLMQSICANQPRILTSPSPSVLYKSVRPEGIELELSVWIADPENGTGQLKSALLEQLLLQLAQHREQICIAQPATLHTPLQMKSA